MNKTRLAKFAFIIGTVVTMIAVASVDDRTPAQIEAAKAASAKDAKETTLVFSAVKALQDSLRDPESLKVEFAGVTEKDTVCIEYRARNGFGGYTQGVVVGIAGKKLSNSNASWNAHCANKQLSVRTSAAQYATK
jgi:hypothetical protein